MSTGALTTYAELAEIVDNLPMLIREKRRRCGLSLRQAAAEIGCSFTTVTRFEQADAGWNGRLLADLLRWLDAPTPTPDDHRTNEET